MAEAPKRSLLREPFVLFLIIGAGLFGLSLVFGPEQDPDPLRDPIVIDEGDVESIVARWRATWHRPPTDEELRVEIERYVRRQILYREGLAMGLDRDDIVIQRRIVQKVEFLAADLAEAEPLGEADLRAYYRAHLDVFTVPTTLDFRHVLFSRDRRGQDAEFDAAAVLSRVHAGELTSFEAVAAEGDASLLPVELRDADPTRIAGTFGEAFAEAVAKAPASTPTPGWLEPVGSSFGVHLVELREVSGERPLAFETVRERVHDELERARRKAAEDALYQRARARYDVVYDLGSPVYAGEGAP